MLSASKFEIHYYLANGSHSLDAQVRNKCEAEFLAIAYEIINELGIQVSLEAEALQPGGLRNIWKAIGENSRQATLFFSILTAFFTYQMIPDKELEELKKEEIHLNIEKLKKELEKDGEPSEEAIDEAAAALSKKGKVVARRSQFYNTLAHTPKVKKVGYVTLNQDNQPQHSEKEVDSKDFIKFVLRTNKLPLEVIETEIEIVAPVLKEGKAKWKGLWEEGPLSFEMNDNDFKRAVLSGAISFKSGDSIFCVLEIHRELSETGEIKITKFAVPVVLDKVENNIRNETRSGKAYRHQKEIDLAQGSLNFTD